MPKIIARLDPSLFVTHVTGICIKNVPAAQSININDSCIPVKPCDCINTAYTGVNNINLLKKQYP